MNGCVSWQGVKKTLPEQLNPKTPVLAWVGGSPHPARAAFSKTLLFAVSVTMERGCTSWRDVWVCWSPSVGAGTRRFCFCTNGNLEFVVAPLFCCCFVDTEPVGIFEVM